MSRKPLGRGLSALLGDDRRTDMPIEAASATAFAATSEMDIDLIEPNPDQPRVRFSDQELDELAASIRANGIVQPIVVRKLGSRYQIVAGERRWRAAQRAELRKVPVAIRDIDDDKLLEIALVENIQRQQLNPIEEANAYRKLIDTVGLTQEQVSERVGKERSLIATTIRLLKLPDDLQKLVIDGSLSLSHGRALLMTDDPKLQRVVAHQIVDKAISVRETERQIKKGARPFSQVIDNKGIKPTLDPNFKAAETKLMRKLSTNVRIIPGKKAGSGKIEIEYYGTDDLDRLYQELIK